MARLPDDEIQRRLEINVEIYRDSVTPEQALELWPDLTAKERERRRKLKESSAARYATIVDDEAGTRLLGGPQQGAAVRGKKAVMEAIADLANDDRQKEIIDALFAPLDKKEPAAVRGKAAERIIKIAAEQTEVERRNREELHQLGKEDLVARLVAGILNSGSGDDLIAGLVKAGERKVLEASATSVDADRAA